MDRKIGKIFLVLAAIMILAALVWLVYPGPPPVPAKPLPNPNGYTNLVEASRLIAGATWDFTTMSREELQILVENCTNALQQTRTALQQECRVPLQFSEAYQKPYMDEQLSSFKILAQALAAEGRLAEMEERFSDAAKAYLDVVHLGTESGRGGLLIGAMVGQAVQAIGIKYLQGLTHRLDAKACRQTATALETLDAQRESWTEIMQHERDWSQRTFPGLKYRLARLINRRSLKQTDDKVGKRFDTYQAQARLLTLELAARAFELERGQRPKAAADLVPEYLKTVPQDPFTGTNLVWIP